MAERPRDDLAAELDVALELADAADAFTLPRFERADFTLGWKDDRSEVTEVDRDAEALLAAELASRRPDHGVFGEEHGLQGATGSPWRWVLDPIDGTSGFVRGIPVWGTLIALVHEDLGPVVGVVSAPALRRRWWAARGLGAFADGRRCQVSDVAMPADAQVSVTFSDGWDRLGLAGELMEIAHMARRARGLGDFWQHCLVAEGALDLAIDAVGVALYDVAAVRVIVAEAGGTITDRHGRPPVGGDGAISSNGLLHDDVIARLGAG
ncbi:MAG: histidinol-phosphatase [Ilumatobacter sp.]|nr:histidinol-phosphatase [Ilumatobacter sp.]